MTKYARTVVPLLLVALTCSMTPAAASTSQTESSAKKTATAVVGDIDSPRVTVSKTEALKIDATIMSSQYPNISVKEASAIIEQAQSFAVASLAIEEQYPEVYAGKKVKWQDGSFDAEILLKGVAPAALTASVAAIPTPVSVKTDAKWTQKEIRKSVEAATTAAVDINENGDVSADFDVESGTVMVAVGLRKNGNKEKLKEELKTAKTKAKKKIESSGIVAPEVVYTADETSNNELAVISGGTALSSTKYGGVYCTASFTANGVIDRSSGIYGKTGFLTADHCKGSIWYEGQTYMSGISAWDPSVTTDARFVYSSQAIRRDFIFGRTSSGTIQTRPVLYKANPAVDDFICTFGWRTKEQQCDTVYSINGSQYYADVDETYYGMVTTRNKVVSKGDSGGPWFYSNTAFGITSGYNDSPFIWASYFGTIRDAERRTGTAIKVT